MLINTNKTDEKGSKIYFNKMNGKEVTLPTGSPCSKGGEIPHGVFGRFIHPAPSALERRINSISF